MTCCPEPHRLEVGTRIRIPFVNEELTITNVDIYLDDDGTCVQIRAEGQKGEDGWPSCGRTWRRSGEAEHGCNLQISHRGAHECSCGSQHEEGRA